MKETGYCALSQWEKPDRIMMEDFNADNAKVDTALSALAGQMATKADQSALTAEQAARAAADGAEKAAREAADAALEKKAGMQLILRRTLTAAARQIQVDPAEIGWEQWSEVRMVCKPVENATFGARGDGPNPVGLGSTTQGILQIFLYPTFDANNCVSGRYSPFSTNQDGAAGLFSRYVAYSTLTAIIFETSGSGSSFKAGTVLEIWGRR